ncbi:MAG: cytochrome c3 family protein [Desulfobulbaceae bacterium]|nr:cytochrome c3 family protein [Desulfobulbaceae bacterium]
MNLKSLVVMLVLARVFSVGVTLARTNDMKQPCGSCHTMHNSQNRTLPAGSVSGGRGALLINSCYGCHTGTYVAGGRPMVLHSSSPIYQNTGTEIGHNTLAGGDFYWVAQGNNLMGHNVNGFTAQASRTPPGGSKLFDSGNPLSCAGINGCHGDLSITDETVSMYQSHHAVEPSPDPRYREGDPAKSLAFSYRFLKGIAGYEDTDYEMTVDRADHNQYKGIARVIESSIDSKSISYSCARCHGDFHNGSLNAGIWDDGGGTTFGDPWIRHPVDYDMAGLSGEYAGYGNPDGDYNIATPVGSIDISAVKATVTGAGNAIVVCVSCHRAHGSPYEYSLRWDYKSWPSAGYNGCGDCHTAKD